MTTLDLYFKLNSLLNRIWDMRDELIVMNLPYFFSACKGMYFNKMALLEKGTEGTRHLVEKYGYDTKQALHSIRVLECIMTFANQDFKDFKSAITYDSVFRRNMLDIKKGCYSLNEFKFVAESKFKAFMSYEELYKAQKPREDVKDELTKQIKKIVKLNI